MADDHYSNSPYQDDLITSPAYQSFQVTKVETPDELALGEPAMSTSASVRNFRSKKRNRVMQSCVACHAQKRKCDRKRPCTRCTEHGIAGQCVYQLEDPTVREGPEQDELLRLRGRVAELERTVRVLMQKPLSKRAAAALEIETDALLGTSSHRKRKIATTDPKHGDGDRAYKQFRPTSHIPDQDEVEWHPFHEPSVPSPIDSALSPFAPTPASTHGDYHHIASYMAYGDAGITPPGDVPTPPYSTFPTPTSDAGSPFKRPIDPAQRRYSESAALANMLSQTHIPHSPESMSPTSPASVASFAGGHMHSTTSAGVCGCGLNPIGSEVLQNLHGHLEAAFDVVKTLPDHSSNLPCNVIFAIADLMDAITVSTSSTTAPAITASPPPPPPATGPSSSSLSHLSPLSDSSVSPASTIATPPQYMMHQQAPHLSHNPTFLHNDVPTVSGFTSLSSWAAFSGSTSFLDSYQGHDIQPHFNGSSLQPMPIHHHQIHVQGASPIPQMIYGHGHQR